MNTKPIFFNTPAAFRHWLEKNHDKAIEVFVGYYKKLSGKPSMTWSESVDEALCFGWIDGVRKSIDDERYFIRFTPRKPNSIWSAVNIKKIDELTQKGLMHTAGIGAYNKRSESKSRIYSYEKDEVKLDAATEKKLKANKKAWKFFEKQGAYYQKRMTNWVMSAKAENTKLSRLEKLITACEEEKKL